MTPAKEQQTVRTTKRAYSYVRFSTPEQSKGDSLRRQTEAACRYCERNGLILDDSLTLRDMGVSAFRGKNAAKGRLAAFLDAIKRGKVAGGSALIVESLDRLSRNEVVEALELFLGIIRSGITVVTLTPEQKFEPGNVDTTQLIIAITVMARAHEESAMKSHRLKQAWETKRAKGRDLKLTARGPSWLRLNDDRTKFEVITNAVAVVRRIFQMAVDGDGTHIICQRLNSAEVPPIGRAVCWHRSYITKILKSRTVLGEFQPCIHHGKTPQGEPIKGYYPTIISEADFYRAQQAIISRRRQSGPRTHGITNLFTGLARDARDGSTMVMATKSKPKGIQRYIVSSAAIRCERGSQYLAIPYGAFERIMLQWLREIKPSDLLDSNRETNDAAVRLAEAQTEVAKVDERIARTKKRIQSDGDIETLLDLLTEMDRQRHQLLAKVESLKVEADSHCEGNLENAQSIVELLANAKPEELQTLRGRLKTAIASLVSEIWVLVDGHKAKRSVTVQVDFKGGGRRFINMTVRRGVVSTNAIYDKPDKQEFDLREFRELTAKQS